VDHSLGNTLMVEAVNLRTFISMRGTNAGKVYLKIPSHGRTDPPTAKGRCGHC
jgi:hypothetical protein